MPSSDSQSDEDDQDEFQYNTPSLHPHLFTQTGINDLVRDLGFIKEKTELLGSRLRDQNLLAVGTSIYLNRKREQQFTCLLYTSRCV